MTEGLAVLGGWISFLAMLGVLGFYLSKPISDDSQSGRS
jgi:hypothetical protein